MNESEYNALTELSWRRPLTADEQARLDAWLTTHPQQQADWELEVTVNDLLTRLPNAPLASNFTSQVMRAVERDLSAEARQMSLFDRVKRWFRNPAPRLAWALGLVAVGWFGIHQHQANMRSDMAKGLSVMANVASLSNPSMLEDFEAIRRLNTSEDEELYAVLTTK